jgi:hypothetical protein
MQEAKQYQHACAQLKKIESFRSTLDFWLSYVDWMSIEHPIISSQFPARYNSLIYQPKQITMLKRNILQVFLVVALSTIGQAGADTVVGSDTTELGSSSKEARKSVKDRRLKGKGGGKSGGKGGKGRGKGKVSSFIRRASIRSS